MKVSQYMTTPVLTVGPETEFRRAFDLMLGHRIHHLPVVEGGRVVGIVAERDVLLAAANFGSAAVPIAEIMKTPAVCVSENVALKEAARLLVVNHIGSLPVLDARKALVGIITETDIFKIAAGMLHAHPLRRKAASKPVRKAPKKAAPRRQAARAVSAKRTAKKK